MTRCGEYLPLYLAITLSLGCLPNHDKLEHKSFVEFGEKENDLVIQFNRITPKAGRKHWISYYDGYSGTPTWNSFAKLHGRYVLKMQFEITPNHWLHNFARTGKPAFYLLEVTEIDIPKSLQSGIGCRYGDQSTFGIEEWKTLLKNEGDFSSIGIILKTDQPINNFDRVKQ